MIPIQILQRNFSEAFNAIPDECRIFFAPGRVCLIGEHIDYNGGLVLPAALSLGICGIFKEDDTDVLKMRSGLNNEGVDLNLYDEIIFSEKHAWTNYPAGVIKYLKQLGIKIPGGQLLFESDLPTGAGLSSSAAMEVLTAMIFLSLSSETLPDRIELSKLCKEVENNFVGVQCGIMDQFAVAMGKKHNALLLDCNSLKHEYVSVELGEYAMVIFNTNKKRELTDSLFNQRVSECEDALRLIRMHKPLNNLAEADEALVNEFVTNPVSKKRALHVVQENSRVKEAALALKKADIQRFGSLLFQSHKSLREQYEVTGKELDAIVDAAKNHPSCIGAKMSGAGFGGCAFAIVKKDALDGFVKHVMEYYERQIGLKASCYFVEIEDGVRRIS